LLGSIWTTSLAIVAAANVITPQSLEAFRPYEPFRVGQGTWSAATNSIWTRRTIRAPRTATLHELG
jgi:hypothetical protein